MVSCIAKMRAKSMICFGHVTATKIQFTNQYRDLITCHVNLLVFSLAYSSYFIFWWRLATNINVFQKDLHVSNIIKRLWLNENTK